MPGFGGGAIGELVVRVVPDTAGFRSALDRGLSGQQTGAAAGQKIGLAMAGGAAAAFGKGILDFTEFERGLNEVFTLIPDAGQETFDKLTQQTKDFAAEFGVLPQEVIKPLYDSLSAGVPADNVFNFLEDANAFAKAGAVDLAQSVDALTTGVNAFGLGAEGAGRVSDSLFTAVKLGKTTVDELSASLFQVAPIAASFGVSVEDVAAGFATLTAQGTPTSVAATQMKSAIAELGKEGTKASKTFEELSGKSFTQFIAEGGSMVDAAGIMAKGADDLGISIVDMFGSIEAGQAFVGLAADLDKSAANLAAVQDSAGATQTAFEQMEKGIGPAMDKVKARLSVAFLNLGETVAPAVEQFGVALAGVVEVIAALPGPLSAAIVGAIGFGGALLVLSGPIIRTIGLIRGIGTAVAGLTRLLAANPYILLIAATIALGIVIYKNWDKIKAFIGDALDKISDYFDGFVSAATDVWNDFSSTISDIMDKVVGFFQDGWDFVKGIFDSVKTFIEDWWRVLIVVFLGPLGVIINHVTRHWEDIKAITVAVFTQIGEAIQAAWDVITGIFETARSIIEPIVTLWFDAMKVQIEIAMEAIRVAIDIAWSAITGVFETAKNTISGIVGQLTPILDGVSIAVNLVRDAWSGAWSTMESIVTTAKNTIISAVNEIKSAVSSALGPLDKLASGAGKVAGFGKGLLGFDDGGVVPGPLGAPRLILAHGGETVVPSHKYPIAPLSGAQSGPSGAPQVIERTVNLNITGPITVRSDEDLMQLRRELWEAERREAFARGEADFAA